MKRGVHLMQDLVLPMLLWNSVQSPARWRRICHLIASGAWCLVRGVSPAASGLVACLLIPATMRRQLLLGCI